MDVFCNSHRPRFYWTLDELLKDCAGEPDNLYDSIYHKRVRFWTRKWKAWHRKHPSEPFVLRCATCSGSERRIDKKLGKWKVSTRNEQRELHTLERGIDVGM